MPSDSSGYVADFLGNLIGTGGNPSFDAAGNQYNLDGTVTTPSLLSLPWYVWAALGLGAFFIVKGIAR